MRASLQLHVAAIGLLAITACSGSHAPARDDLASAEKLGDTMGDWLGLVPGERPVGTQVPLLLSQTENGRKIWGITHAAVVKTTREAFGKAMRTSTDTTLSSASTALSGALDSSSDASSGGVTISTTPDTASGSISTTPVTASGTLSATPATASGSIPTVPSIGSGAAVSITPTAFMTSAVGTASSADLSSAVCTYIQGFLTFLGTCSAELGTLMNTAVTNLGGCTGFGDSIVAQIGSSVPASAVSTINCVGNALSTATCASESDITNGLVSSFSSCGISIAVSTGS